MGWLGPLGWRSPDRSWPLAIVLGILAALVGILTHLAWDAFTHDSSPLVVAVPFLHAELGPLPVSSWLQHASTIGGLIALALWARAWARRTPRVPSPTVSSPAARVVAWVALAAVFVLMGTAVVIAGMTVGIPTLDPKRVFVAVTVAGGAAGLVGVLICATWWIARGLRGRPAPLAD
jgi:hypothetical protein